MSARWGESMAAMIRNVLLSTALVGVVLALSGCETTNEDEWAGGARKPFHQAEQTCEAQAARIAEESARPAFFTGCMQAFGWTLRAG